MIGRAAALTALAALAACHRPAADLSTPDDAANLQAETARRTLDDVAAAEAAAKRPTVPAGQSTVDTRP